MKRALIVGTGTVMGVAAVLALNPDGTVATPVGSAAASSTTSGTSGTAASGSGSSGSSSAGSSSSSGSTSAGGTYTGSAVDVGRGYGTVQVEVTVTDGRLVDITALALPENDPKSSMISNRAWPTLVQQALAAQSADIAGVSGASYTTMGFEQSLRDALTQAGLS